MEEKICGNESMMGSVCCKPLGHNDLEHQGKHGNKWTDASNEATRLDMIKRSKTWVWD